MNGDLKRSAGLGIEAVQLGNKQWWTDNTMSYDWHNEVAAARFSPAWFDAIDERFITSARLYGTDRAPSTASFPSTGCAEPMCSRSGAAWGCTLSSSPGQAQTSRPSICPQPQ